ncbi:zonadhesin-like [Hemitrygon akajei]|uniref:zonadhesin-like n=1 Tax=Hemitrygon akajei TaxID=2704970 RepID=UPI003BF94370
MNGVKPHSRFISPCPINQDCIHVVDPKPYFDSCVYDLCQFQGLQGPLCDQLQAYTDACQSAGATVHNWRTVGFCDPYCPPNSHYDLCVSLCPATCIQPGGGRCSSKCIEGCACNPGYVLSDSECVPLSDCGCTDQQGDYHVVNESWYLPGCSEVCTCVSPKHLECQETKCSDSEQCGLQDGVYGCHPKGQEMCSASGDPHYRTFDKVYYDFMGNCTYTFSKPCSPIPDLPHFNVETSNEHRGRNTRVSYVKAVHVEVYDYRVTLAKGRRVIVDGKLVNPPIFLEGRLQIRISGGYISLETAFGLRVRYNGNHRVDVTVPSSYAGHLCGLCGNYNGLPADDKRMPDGQDADSFEDLGASWLVPGTPTQCTHNKPSQDCDNDKFKESWNCGFIKDPKGPFQECNKHIPVEQYFKDCVYDMSCGPHDEAVSLCFALQAYADACAQAGVAVSWRNKTFCPLSCPAGSHYEPCTNACPASCTDLSAPNDCTHPCVEGCACDPGYVLSGDRCVPFEQCGCEDPGRNYHQMGESWFTNMNCTERCTCSSPNNMTCEPWQCGPLENCEVQNGVLGCHTLGSTSCHVSGDPHYYTFDKAMHTFLGTCTYTLVAICNATMITPFTISAKNEERGLRYASYLSQIYIDVLGLQITLQKSGRIKLDDTKIRTPFKDEVKGVSIYTTGIYTVLETKFGLMVRFDGNHHLEIKLPNSYYGKVCGMCGNFNNDITDELLMPNGLLAKNVPQFGNSWQVRDNDNDDDDDDDDDSRCYSDDRDDLSPPCIAGEESKLRSQCGELLSAKYSQCHDIVDPTPFIENCVFDLCTYGGMVSALCDNIQSYVEVCKSEGVGIKWRNNTFCPLACGKNSHYTECASSCPATCTDIYASSTCDSKHTCAEGCECDSGFVLSGDLCVRLEDCGCLDYNDDYYQSGDKWLNKRCDTKCTCSKGQLSCKAHKCNENSVCALKKNGQYGCRPVSFETCLISGDPHYLTFDGLVHHFQGKHTYILVKTYADSETLQPFIITGRNRVRYGNKKVSYLSEVHIEVYGHLIEFHKKKLLLLDDEELTPPYKSAEGFHIYQKSRTLYLETDFGLSVNFDGKENADIIIPSLYKKKVRGLCGNYDGKYKNDFTLPDGGQVSSLKQFGNSWKVKSHDDDDDDDESVRRTRWTQPSNGNRNRRGAAGEDAGPEPETGYEACTDSQHNSTDSCGALLDPRGPFRDCHPFIQPEMYYQNCLFDLCQTTDSAMLCANFEMYVQACQLNGTALLHWRNYTHCVMDCPPNSSYKPCMSACPPTCANLAATSECDGPCMEGCQCNRGFVYSGYECVPYRSCGCTYRNKYYEVGERFVTEDCTEECICNTTEAVQCLAMRCPANTTCKVIDFKRACVTNCLNDTCQNGGTCEETVNGINCVCPALYRGKYCEDNTILIVITVLIPVVVLILIAAGMILYFCCRNGEKGDSNSLSDVSSLGSFDDIARLTQNWRVTQGSGVTNPRYQM